MKNALQVSAKNSIFKNLSSTLRAGSSFLPSLGLTQSFLTKAIFRGSLQILFLLAATLSASDPSDSTRTLRISTWPSGAELYIGNRPASFARKAPFRSPHELRLESADTVVRATLFKPGYSDTTLDIHVADFPHSFAWIALEEADLYKIELQEQILDRRKNRQVGKILFASSLVPLALAGTFAAIAESRFQDAEKARKKIENSVIREGKAYRSFERTFSNAKESGKNYRTAAIVSLGFSALFLVSAVIFYF